MHVKVISNSSPPIYLYRLGLLEKLPSLYPEIYVPGGVLKEHLQGREFGYATPDLSIYPWVRTVDIAVNPELASFPELGHGELEALSLALTTPGSIVLLDEFRARKIAKDYSIQTRGTVSLLISAKELGLIHELKPQLDRLLSLGFRLHPSVYQQALQIAEE